MDRRPILWLILLPALATAGVSLSGNTLKCDTGTFEEYSKELTDPASGEYTCLCQDEGNNDCTVHKVLVKVRTADSTIELDVPALVSVLVSDITVTALIGWAVYSICAQPRVRSSFQGSKASDKVNLISNSAAGDTYQPLNARTGEYSTLHAHRKNKNAKYAMSP